MTETETTPARDLLRRLPPARLIGWAVVLIGVYILVAQVRSVVDKKHALPDIRHRVYWSKNLYQQARRNKSHAVASELASFYLIEKLLENTELIIEPGLEVYRWNLERVSRTRVTVSPTIGKVPSATFKGLELATPHTGTINKRKLYVLVAPAVKTYVFVSTVGETDPLYIVPESVYRSRAADKSGANLSAP